MAKKPQAESSGNSNVLSPEMIRQLKDQLLIVLVKRNGGIVDMPVSEVDATGQDLLNIDINAKLRTFRITLARKH